MFNFWTRGSKFLVAYSDPSFFECWSMRICFQNFDVYLPCTFFPAKTNSYLLLSISLIFSLNDDVLAILITLQTNRESTLQRELIYTERKPLGRLCKMCNPFCNESRTTLPLNVFLLRKKTERENLNYPYLYHGLKGSLQNQSLRKYEEDFITKLWKNTADYYILQSFTNVLFYYGQYWQYFLYLDWEL